jgi:hypothetical protein
MASGGAHLTPSPTFPASLSLYVYLSSLCLVAVAVAAAAVVAMVVVVVVELQQKHIAMVGHCKSVMQQVNAAGGSISTNISISSIGLSTQQQLVSPPTQQPLDATHRRRRGRRSVAKQVQRWRSSRCGASKRAGAEQVQGRSAVATAAAAATATKDVQLPNLSKTGTGLVVMVVVVTPQ